MGALAYALIVADPEVRLPVRAEPMCRPARFGLFRGHGHDQTYAERCQRLFVEPPRAFRIGNRKSDVIEHEHSSFAPIGLFGPQCPSIFKS
jgi:hypothetical protein